MTKEDYDLRNEILTLKMINSDLKTTDKIESEVTWEEDGKTFKLNKTRSVLKPEFVDKDLVV